MRLALVVGWGDSDFVAARSDRLRVSFGEGRFTDSGRSDPGEFCVPGVVFADGTGV